MPSAILIAYIVCFSIGLVSSTKLLYRDAMPHSVVETNGTSRTATSKERFVAAAFDLAQVFLFINDITAIAIAIASISHFKWIDLSITFTLQLLTSMNFVRHLQGLFMDRTITYLPYIAAIILTARDSVRYLGNPFTRDPSGFLIWDINTEMLLIYESVILFTLSIGPLTVVRLSYRSLRQHRNSGRNNQNYKVILMVFFIINMAVVLSELCGTAIILRSVLLSKPETGTRDGIFLVCTFAQILSNFSIAFPIIIKWIIKGINGWEAIFHLLERDYNNSQGAFELNSQDSPRGTRT
ncbi:unnamed protein product [Periconia digitata]|uniref:Uncharacterized protein n=1 Tax=Periconia digitata TaxID=1303443 RepID=A0A9W4XVH2_9PLEO|nr:unnamed protein product [Periconia digitata]